MATAVAAALGTGCVSVGKKLTYDHHEVRLMQAAETGRHVADESEWQQLKHYIEARVVQIAPYDPAEKFDRRAAAMRGGRGCAVTPDGYFLTAYHVVDDGPFVLIETRGYSHLSPGQTYRAGELDALLTHKKYPGRIVWFDERLDLAIVKFERNQSTHFSRNRSDIRDGDTVYSADDEGMLVLPRPRGNQPLTTQTMIEGMIGNGPFAVAGQLEEVARDSKHPHAIKIATSLVARGGMSGGPLVTENGELCGILLGYTKPILPPGDATTRAAFLDPQYIRAIIKDDRRRH